MKHIGIQTITSDGACLFRSVRDQLYGDGGDQSHTNLHVKVCGWLEKENNNFKTLFVTTRTRASMLIYVK